MTNRQPTTPPERQAFRTFFWQRPQTQTALLVSMIIVVALIIGALYLAQATVTATTGSQLLALRDERDRLARLNQDMEAQIAYKRNLAVMTGRAKSLGFVPADSDEIQYLVVDGYTIIRATPTPIATPQPEYTYTETFDGWVRDQWNRLVQQFEAWAGNNQPTPMPGQ
ncbi:MAG: hypothetical protein U0528_19765 [Anaerolineae bacterium]|nr:hypothetical protein [Anaerolineae bacterium]